MAGQAKYPFHHQWQQPPPPAQPIPPPAHSHVHPQPHSHPPVQVPGENPNRTTNDELRTIFITGLPADVKERELQNLLRWLPGYEASQLNHKQEPPMGFALFSTGQFAIAAKDALQEMVFDAEVNSILHTEMAKKNLFVKRGVVTDSNTFDQSKRMRTGGDFTQPAYQNTQPAYQNTQPSYPNPPPFHQPPPPVWGHQQYMAHPPQPQYDPYGAYPLQVAPVPMPTPAPLPAPGGYAPVQNSKDNPPCNTLFIGNLGENVIEEEVRNLFSVQPGFKQMKILRQERNTVCFIEYNDVNSARNVHQNLQGAVVPSSGRGGMRIQYSKNPYGRRKDGFNPAGGSPEVNGAPFH